MEQFLAQITPPSSGDFWNPANWPTIIEKLGIGGFFALVLFGIFIAFGWRMMNQWDKHLKESRALNKEQFALCRYTHGPGGVANNQPLIDAAHECVDMVGVLAQGIGPDTAKAVAPHIASAHSKLRKEPPPVPETNIASLPT